MTGAPGAPDPAELARLDAAVRSLGRIDREIFLAHRLDAMPYAEIARQTGLEVVQVERRMARAIYRIDWMMNRRAPPWWRRLSWRWF